MHYEAARAAVMEEGPPQGALGLYVLREEGMREWLRVTDGGTRPALPEEPPLNGSGPLPPSPSMFVKVLANLATSIAREGYHDH